MSGAFVNFVVQVSLVITHFKMAEQKAAAEEKIQSEELKKSMATDMKNRDEENA